MQRVVLDGVRRQTAAGTRPQALVLGTRRERPIPLAQNTVTRIGMDGVRRSVPTPRQLLEQVVTPELIVEAAPLIPEVAPPRRSFARPVVGFSVLASALIVAGLTGSHFVNANAAADTQLRPTPAPTVAATPAATPTTVPTPAKAAATTNQTFASAQALIDSFVAAHGSQYTIYVKDLKTGVVSSSNADRVMRSASLYKLFVAQRVYQLVDSGDITYSRAAGSESGGNTVQGCLNLMITISDNACGHDLGQIVGWSKIDSLLKSAGFTGTTLGNTINAPQMTNAKDVGLLLERLYTQGSMSPNSTDAFLSLLKGQRVNDRFPKGLPTGTVIAHKTGDLLGYTHDAAIIYGKKTDFVVVVMSGPWTSPEGSKPAFGTLAGQLNNYFNN